MRMWDLRTAATHGEAISDDLGWLGTFAVGEIDGVPLAVTGKRTGLQTWDLRTGTPRTALVAKEPLEGPWPRVVAIEDVDGTPVAVTRDSDSVMMMWNLRIGTHRRTALHHGPDFLGKPTPRQAEDQDLRVVAAATVDGIPIALTGNDDGTVQVWDLKTGKARRDPLRGHEGFVSAVAIGQIDGTPIAVTGGLDDTVRIWDLRTRRARGKPLHGHSSVVSAVAIGQIHGTPVAVTGSWDSTVRLWDLRAGTEIGKPLRGHTSRVTVVATGEVDGTPLAVSGDSYGQVRLWTLDSDPAASCSLEALSEVRHIAFADQLGWLTLTANGSLFLWRPTSVPSKPRPSPV